MSDTLQQKQQQLKDAFAICTNVDERYRKMISMGRTLPPFLEEYKTKENLVAGCQSLLYLNSNMEGGLLYFTAYSEALISAGLASLLIAIYSGEKPETILQYPPTFLEEMGIPSILTPSRANGLYSLHLKMKQDALKWLLR